ncbi:MAG: type II toxin-antitoxin system HicB family antitoxin [Chloroflexi bacterium]|nr:type II toxin-antitoxin system HicB family antitoxin [Chloroflexota bacterium]
MNHSNYTIIVEPGEDGWLAYMPAMPACYAPGETPDEALRELKIVVEMILEEYEEEGKPRPSPLPGGEGITKGES